MDDIQKSGEDHDVNETPTTSQPQDAGMSDQMPEPPNAPLKDADPILHSKYTSGLVLLGVLLAIALLFGISVGHTLSGGGLHTSGLSQAYRACRGEQTSDDENDEDSNDYDETQDEYESSEEGNVHTTHAYVRNQAQPKATRLSISKNRNTRITSKINDDESNYLNVSLGYIKLKDEGKTLIVSEPPEQVEVFDCVADSLSMPESVRSKVGTTNAFAGQRTDSWKGYTITWSYSGFEGLNAIIESK